MSEPTSWEQQAMERMLHATIKEQRRARRWSIFFKLVFLAYIILVTIAVWPTENVSSNSKKMHASVIDINGMIGPDSNSSAQNITKSLEAAFKDKYTKGIILRIDSPGGAPVQADYIYHEIKRLRDKHKDVKVYAVCSDICASAAYYIASSSDFIYANPSSLVGSIGVLVNGFGFVDTMEKIGVQRRLYTAGSNKGFLDPFSPVKPEDKDYMQYMLDQVHGEFIKNVKLGRGLRLSQDPVIFSGRIFTGIDAKKFGLIDDFKSSQQVADDILKVKDFVNYTKHPSFIDRLTENMSSRFANSMLQQFSLPQ